jgi:dTDP-4-amino-4,6-dideoxygalactose transaminase
MKELRDQGQSKKYYHERVGYNYRMEAIQGAVLGVKLKHLEEWNAARRRHADVYRRELADLGLRLLEVPPDCESVYHIFPLFTEQRDELRKHLHASGVSTGVHYPIPVHLQPGFRKLGYNEGDLPETERVCREVLSLPLYPELTNDMLLEITDSVRQFCRQAVAVHP